MGSVVVGGHIVGDATMLLLLEDVLWEIFVIRECVVCREVVRLVIGCESFPLYLDRRIMSNFDLLEERLAEALTSFKIVNGIFPGGWHY